MTEPATSILKLTPHHCGISVPDLETSIAWYGDMLGFSVEKRTAVEKANARIAFIRNGDSRIELFEVAGAAPLPESRRHPDRDIATHGTKHMAFKVQGLRKLMDTLKQRGVDVAVDVFAMGDDLVAFIRDNSGILIELIEQP